MRKLSFSANGTIHFQNINLPNVQTQPAPALMEGKVIILTDTSPSALILPTSIFDMIEEANDYYFPPITGIYLKISRVLITLLTVFMFHSSALYAEPAWIPEIFRFVLIEDTVNIPLIFQILILELAIDGLRLAALNTPSMLSTLSASSPVSSWGNSPSNPAGSTARSCSTWHSSPSPTTPSQTLN